MAKRWRGQRDKHYKQLRIALLSARYGRFIEALARRSSRTGRESLSLEQGRSSIETFTLSRLENWRRKLVAKGRKLKKMSTRQRHRLRMRAKRFRYALDWSLPVLTEKRTILRKQIRQARAVQNSLGKLNDAATHRTQADELGIAPLPGMAQISRRISQRDLLKTTMRALKTLDRLKLGA
jgi:CHAD domain-containing protein